MKLRHVYFTLCVAGTLIPYLHFVPWVAEHGLNLPFLMRDVFVNHASAFFALDVFVSAVVVFVFVYGERKRMRGWWWLPVAGVLCVGVSCGLPLALYLRERSNDEDFLGR